MDGCTPLVLKVRKKVIENGNRKEETTTCIRIFRDWDREITWGSRVPAALVETTVQTSALILGCSQMLIINSRSRHNLLSSPGTYCMCTNTQIYDTDTETHMCVYV